MFRYIVVALLSVLLTAMSGYSQVPLNMYSANTIKSSSATTFTAGDFVCLDTTNTTGSSGGSSAYVNTIFGIDNGTVRCPPGQPQIGIVASTDVTNVSNHSVLLMTDSPRNTLTSPLTSQTFPVTFLQPCNALTITVASFNNPCFR